MDVWGTFGTWSSLYCNRMNACGGQFRRPNPGRWEAQLHLTDELGKCRMKVNGLTVWTWYPCCDGVDSGDMIVSY